MAERASPTPGDSRKEENTTSPIDDTDDWSLAPGCIPTQAGLKPDDDGHSSRPHFATGMALESLAFVVGAKNPRIATDHQGSKIAAALYFLDLAATGATDPAVSIAPHHRDASITIVKFKLQWLVSGKRVPIEVRVTNETDYAHIRQHHNAAGLIDALTYTVEPDSGAGRSGCRYALTADERFRVKEIKRSEHLLRTAFRLRERWLEGPSTSLLVSILGHFSVDRTPCIVTAKSTSACSPSLQPDTLTKNAEWPFVSADTHHHQLPSCCFKCVKVLSFVEAVRRIMGFRDIPEGRPDLVRPDDDIAETLLRHVAAELPRVKARREAQAVLRVAQLTEDELSAIVCYTIEHPYPLYKWLNAWLMGQRRDAAVRKHVGPFFALLYGGLKKLPRQRCRASRGVLVGDFAPLRATFDNYETVCARGALLSFSGVASFSTKDAVATKRAFIGNHGDDSILYTCGDLECVSLQALSLSPQEAEVVPLPPSSFTVVSCIRVQRTLVVTIEQRSQSDVAYVVPRTAVSRVKRSG